MPGIITGGNPYPLVQDILNLARARVNDTAISIDGSLLSNTQPYTLTLLNGAWRWIQAKCATAGVSTFVRTGLLQGIPVAALQDTAYESSITWAGCSDGVNQMSGPALPPDLILPLKVGVRNTSTTGEFTPLLQADNGLPEWLDTNVYDWREDGMYFYGKSIAQDMKLRYAAYRADLTLDVGAQAPIMFCQDAMSARLAYEFANMRGAVQAPAMAAASVEAFNTISQKSARMTGRKNIRRQSYSNRRCL